MADRKPWTTSRTWITGLFFLALIVALMVWLPAKSFENRYTVLFTALTAIIVLTIMCLSRAVTGYFRAIFIMDNYRISLSRVQVFFWTVIFLSTLLAAVTVNLNSPDAAIAAKPIDIRVPETLIALMGISVASFVASPLVVSVRQSAPAKPDGFVSNTSPAQASWSDLFKGEEEGNKNTIDLSRVQMFLFTVVAVGVYFADTYAVFRNIGDPKSQLKGFTEFAEFSSMLVAIIGISHAGYLGMKAIPAGQSKDQPKPGRNQTKPGKDKSAQGKNEPGI